MMKTTKKQNEKLTKIYDDYARNLKNSFQADVLQSESLLISAVFVQNKNETLLYQWFNNLISIDAAIEKIIG